MNSVHRGSSQFCAGLEMEANRIQYSKAELLNLRESRRCICVPRLVKRKLKYFKLFADHIQVLIRQRPRFLRQVPSDQHHDHKPIPASRRCLSRICFENKKRHGKKDHFPSILLTNARSLFHKIDELRMRASQMKPCIIAITESWLSPDIPDVAINIEGYQVHRLDRSSHGGGILCYLRSSLSSANLDIDYKDSDSTASTGSEFLTVFVKDMSLLLVVIYHPFWGNNSANEVAISRLTNIVDTSLLKFGESLRLLICGDFNGLRDCYSSIESIAQLTQVVDFPTRGLNILDQIFVNFARNHKASSFSPLGRSDHRVVVWTPPTTVRQLLAKRKVRKFTKANVARFCHQVSSIDWVSVVKSIDDLDASVTFFQDSLTFLFNKCFPLRTVRLRSSDPPWLKPSLKILIDDRDKAFHKRQWTKYRRLCQEVIAHTKHLKNLFIKSSSASRTSVSSSQSRDLWNSLRTVGGLSRPNTPLPFSSDDFNLSFASNFQPPTLSHVSTSSDVVDEVDICVTPEEVHRELVRLRRKSPGPDGLPFWVFKVSADYLCHAVAYLINRSFKECRFPSCFKAANVCPVPKVSQPRSLSDFRPISLLCSLSKVLEKMMLKKVILPTVIVKLKPTQFAYISRPGSGTVSALVLTYHRILEFLDHSSGCVRLLTTDFSKAFEKIPHEKIVNSCIEFGLPSYAVTWISSFLCARQQRVVLNGKFSDWTPITSGVPQGSVLGPVLFCMAIDDLVPQCRNTSVVKYADDVTFLHFVRCPADDNLQCEWDNLIAWSRHSGLPVNEDKCKIFDVVTKKNIVPCPVMMSNGVQVKQVPSMSFLGVVFSSDLKWNLHFDNVYKKAMRRVFVVRNLRKCDCSPALMTNAYFAFIRSVLLYAFPCVCNAPSFLLRKLLRVEKRVSRIIGESISPTLLEAADVSCKKLLSAISKHPQHPLRDLFLSNSTSRTRSSLHLRRRFTRTERLSSSFIKYAE